jgi:eukaryotic-like serine/threonine-protein kinase
MQGHVFLGKYKVTRLLDEGGMSKIYLAHQIIPNRDVVVKVLKEEMRNNTKAQEHFRREIHIMSRFQHANAVAYYDSASNDAAGPVLVMEYLRGTDLGLLLYRQGRFSSERVGRLLGQLCDVLELAHIQGVVHCDVKPGNLMVLNAGTPQESLKLMDFGLAKMSSMLYIAPEDIVNQDALVASGTPEYISPEQIRGSEIDGRADIYSVGVLLYEMLTGKRPFNAKSPAELMRQHLKVEPPTFAALGVTEDIPPGIEALVRSCMAKTPDGRPRNAEALAQRYEQALGKRIMPIRNTAKTTTPLGTAANAPAAPPNLPPIRRAAHRHAILHSVEAVMPEAMAMIKLKGYIYDLGGEVIESVPGLIRVRLPKPNPAKKRSSIFAWLEKGDKPAVLDPADTTTVELRMERRDATQVNNLTITLVITPARGPVSKDWQDHYQNLGRELKAYMMGR